MAIDVSYDVRTGRLTKDVEFRPFEKSTLITGSFATNRLVKKDGQYNEEASFWNFKLWASSEKQVEYYRNTLKKGVAVTVSGSIDQEFYTDKEGNKKSNYVFNVGQILPASTPKADGSSQKKDSVPEYSSDSGFPEDLAF